MSIFRWHHLLEDVKKKKKCTRERLMVNWAFTFDDILIHYETCNNIVQTYSCKVFCHKFMLVVAESYLIL